MTASTSPCPKAPQVKAAEDGVVAYAGSELKGYGNLVLIRHPNGFVTAYANNGSLNVKRGDTVKRGQTIALSGQTGNVSSPQLHFELRKGTKPVDPSYYLAGLLSICQVADALRAEIATSRSSRNKAVLSPHRETRSGKQRGGWVQGKAPPP